MSFLQVSIFEPSHGSIHLSVHPYSMFSIFCSLHDMTRFLISVLEAILTSLLKGMSLYKMNKEHAVCHVTVNTHLLVHFSSQTSKTLMLDRLPIGVEQLCEYMCCTWKNSDLAGVCR